MITGLKIKNLSKLIEEIFMLCDKVSDYRTLIEDFVKAFKHFRNIP